MWVSLMMAFTLAAGTARDRPGTDRPGLRRAPSAPAVGEYQPQPLGVLSLPTLEYPLFTRSHGPLLIPPVPQGPFPCQVPGRTLGIPGVGVSADLTDEFLRVLGQDLYRMRKARFRAATLEVRMKLVVQDHQDNLRISPGQLPERLAELWRHPRDLAPKRRLGVELWREADQGEAGRGFPPYGAHGR